ncbi:DNA polymerase [Paenibacillus alkaliterrae]|nr:DNA polymerase [Paenibacillus alkaliterrae]MCF2939020.1 DNA polymerase [Paenibacillus alkaliterrae]
MTTLIIDIETYSSVDLIKCGVYKYVDSPDFEILLFGYTFDDDPVHVVDLLDFETLPDNVYDALTDPAVTKTAFNANFERTCIAKWFHMPMEPEQWRCTAVHALYLGLPNYLDGVAKVLGLEAQKDTAGKNLIKYFSLPCKPTKANGGRTRNYPHHDPIKWLSYKAYCGQDVVVERDISQVLEQHPIPDSEHRLWALDQKINDRGVRLDPQLVTHAIACDEQYKEKLMAEAVELTGLDNPNSGPQIKAWLLEAEGLEVDSLTKDTVPLLLDQVESNTAKRVLELRQELSKTSVKKYQAMERAICSDSRVRGLLQFYGAGRTGRWAGRLVQVQNLPRNYLSDLGLARQLLIEGNYELLELLFASVPDVLSQLIRTTFVPSDGNTFGVADFSAIEARVIAWLAGEQWRLDVFATHGKIYEASAAQMFKIPLDEVTKDDRQRGKVAELALGYQGGPNALITMGALDKGLKEEELQPLVDAWREANPAIKRFWYAVGDAAVKAVEEQRTVKLNHGISFIYTPGTLFCQLPSGRRLAYFKPRLEDGSYGKKQLSYEGVNDKKQWVRLRTYGGKLVENCLSGETLVLTDKGWARMVDVESDSLLWDGIEWVQHDGLISNGMQGTIDLDGVRVTPDHKILTEMGWRSASSCEGYYRASVSLPNSFDVCGVRREKVTMGNPMRLRKNHNDASERIQEGQTEVMRMSAQRIGCGESDDTRHVTTSIFCGMAIHDRPLQAPDTSSMEELRRSGDFSLLGMGGELRNILAGHGADVSNGIDDRTNGRERGLHKGELLLGYDETAGEQQAEQRENTDAMGRNDSSRSGGSFGDQSDNALLQTEDRVSAEPFVCRTGRYEPVYDIVNAGPRSRFTVLGDSGPMIVHNCVQAIARDCLAESMIRLDAAGHNIVMHVHDEVILDEQSGSLERACEIMGQPISWAPGLPLRADGFECDFYRKD